MKKDIHPKYNDEAVVTCGTCGTTFTVGSTRDSLKVEICSVCHPFYSGTQKNRERGGRAQKFREKYNLD